MKHSLTRTLTALALALLLPLAVVGCDSSTPESLSASNTAVNSEALLWSINLPTLNTSAFARATQSNPSDNDSENQSIVVDLNQGQLGENFTLYATLSASASNGGTNEHGLPTTGSGAHLEAFWGDTPTELTSLIPDCKAGSAHVSVHTEGKDSEDAELDLGTPNEDCFDEGEPKLLVSTWSGARATIETNSGSKPTASASTSNISLVEN